jgi:hypothetical protein
MFYVAISNILIYIYLLIFSVSLLVSGNDLFIYLFIYTNNYRII